MLIRLPSAYGIYQIAIKRTYTKQLSSLLLHAQELHIVGLRGSLISSCLRGFRHRDTGPPSNIKLLKDPLFLESYQDPTLLADSYEKTSFAVNLEHLGHPGYVVHHILVLYKDTVCPFIEVLGEFTPRVNYHDKRMRLVMPSGE